MGPYLALPVLKSYLQEVEQYKVDIVDLNVEFYDDLLSFRHVEECCKRYRESKDSFSSNVQLTIELIQKSALNVDEAKDIFRSKRYFNLKERQYAENIFRNALYIINHVSYDPIRCQGPQWPRRPLAIGRRGLPLNPSRSAPGMSSTPSAQSHIRGYRSVGPHSIPSAGFPKSVGAHAEGSARTAK